MPTIRVGRTRSVRPRLELTRHKHIEMTAPRAVTENTLYRIYRYTARASTDEKKQEQKRHRAMCRVEACLAFVPQLLENIPWWFCTGPNLRVLILIASPEVQDTFSFVGPIIIKE